MLDRNNLHKYQLHAVEHIKQKPRSVLFLDMGLGKTTTTLTAINDLIYDELEIRNALIIGPKRVVESVWHAEVEKWAHLNHLRVVKIVGTPKQRIAATKQKADIYLVSRDNIAWLCAQFGGYKLPYDMLVIDELSSFKNAQSQRFKALKRVASNFVRVVGLTGTPAPNGLIDLWAQMYLIDCGERLGKFITSYREQYFKPEKMNGHIVFKYKMRDKSGEQAIYAKISDIVVSMKARDYLDLPKRVDNYVELELSAEEYEDYQLFERDRILELVESGEEIAALNAAALSNKLLQYANGCIYDAEKNTHFVHDVKIEALKDIVAEAQGAPVLVAYTFQSDKDRILKTFKGAKLLKDDQDVLDWNAGKIPMLIMHPASGGHGLNLQAGGNIIVWFGQTWSLELYEQFNARLDRQGQKKSVIIHHLIAKNTIDRDVISALKNKASGQNALMDAVKARIKKYVSR